MMKQAKEKKLRANREKEIRFILSCIEVESEIVGTSG
jgi:hypothetical protein